MREYLQMLQLPGQFHHPQRSLDVALDRFIQSGIEVDAGRAVDDNMAGLDELFLHFFDQAEGWLMQISLSTSKVRYMGWTLLWMNSSNFPL